VSVSCVLYFSSVGALSKAMSMNCPRQAAV